MNSQTIFHIIPSLGRGGAERLLVDLASSWKNGSFNHVICVLSKENCYPAEVAALLESPNIRLVTGVAPRATALAVALVRIAQMMRQERAVIVVGWLYIGALVAKTVGKLCRVSTIWSIHASDFSMQQLPPTSRMAMRIIQLAKPWPDHVQYCSSSAQEFHESRYKWPKKIGVTIENGIQFKRVCAGNKADLMRRLNIDPSKIIILFVGRHARQKGHDVLVRAWKRISSAHMVLLMVGPGLPDPDDGAAYEADNIRVCQPTSDLADYYAAADALVLPSVFGEALPLVVIEALGNGVPVVASNLPALIHLKATIGDDAPITLFATGDAEALSDQLARVTGRHAEDQSYLQDNIKRMYNIELAAQRYEDFYRAVAERHELPLEGHG